VKLVCLRRGKSITSSLCSKLSPRSSWGWQGSLRPRDPRVTRSRRIRTA